MELPCREAIAPLLGDHDEAGGAMTEASERRADTTRQRLIAAASRQFAHRPYSMVSLDEILTEAELTKGAMYFHFRSKQALVLAIIDDLTEMSRAAVTESLTRQMSGLETLIDLVFAIAVQDIQHDVTRAGSGCSRPWIAQPPCPPRCGNHGSSSSPPSSKKQSPTATSSTSTIPKTSPKCWWRCGRVSAESAISTNPSTTSITCQKHGHWHYPASPIPTESTTSPNSSTDATPSP